MSEAFLTTEEVAQRLRVTDQTILAYLRAGELRGVRLGRFWRVRESDLQRLLQARSNSASWGEELDAVLMRLRSRVPEDIPEEEIERDAVAAVHEARQRIRANGR